MIKAILFAVLFAIIGLIVFAFLGPLLFHGVDPRKMGEISAPVIVCVLGLIGFVFGWRRHKKR
jgi:hypothetical protein